MKVCKGKVWGLKSGVGDMLKHKDMEYINSSLTMDTSANVKMYDTPAQQILQWICSLHIFALQDNMNDLESLIAETLSEREKNVCQLFLDAQAGTEGVRASVKQPPLKSVLHQQASQ